MTKEDTTPTIAPFGAGIWGCRKCGFSCTVRRGYEIPICYCNKLCRLIGVHGFDLLDYKTGEQARYEISFPHEMELENIKVLTDGEAPVSVGYFCAECYEEL